MESLLGVGKSIFPKAAPPAAMAAKGGSVVLVADAQIDSLDWYRNRRILKADNGKPGGANCRAGANGPDLNPQGALRHPGEGC